MADAFTLGPSGSGASIPPNSLSGSRGSSDFHFDRPLILSISTWRISMASFSIGTASKAKGDCALGPVGCVACATFLESELGFGVGLSVGKQCDDVGPFRRYAWLGCLLAAVLLAAADVESHLLRRCSVWHAVSYLP